MKMQFAYLSLACACACGAGCASLVEDPGPATPQRSAASAGAAAIEPDEVDPARATTLPAAAPIALDPSIDTVWAYLAARYDDDGDGRLTSEEYDRDTGRFDTWDRDDDGVLTSADFERSEGRATRRGSSGGNNMAMGRTRRTLARYFQTDGEPGLLPLSEAREAFGIYDGSDGSAPDGRVTEGEFTCAMEQLRVVVPGDDSEMVEMAMGESSAWSLLVGGLDSDGDGALVEAELHAFYADVMGTQTIDYRGWSANGAPGRRPARAGRGERADRGAGAERGDDLAAQVGAVAPDFALASPGGETRYTLSSFRGERPVALIFGSYT